MRASAIEGLALLGVSSLRSLPHLASSEAHVGIAPDVVCPSGTRAQLRVAGSRRQRLLPLLVSMETSFLSVSLVRLSGPQVAFCQVSHVQAALVSVRAEWSTIS